MRHLTRVMDLIPSRASHGSNNLLYYFISKYIYAMKIMTTVPEMWKHLCRITWGFMPLAQLLQDEHCSYLALLRRSACMTVLLPKSDSNGKNINTLKIDSRGSIIITFELNSWLLIRYPLFWPGCGDRLAMLVTGVITKYCDNGSNPDTTYWWPCPFLLLSWGNIKSTLK